MKKRVLSLFLAMALLLSMAVTATAAESAVYGLDAAGQIVAGFATLEEAISNSNGSIVTYQLNGDLDGQVISKDIQLDLNGHDLTNVTVPAGVTLYGIDSATDGYAGSFGTLSGKIEGTVAATVKTAAPKSYVALCEDGSWSFHRYYASITAISLNPAQAALGYKAEFYGDKAVKNAVVNYGYALWVNDYAPKTFTVTDKLEKNTLTLRLKNILRENNDAVNAVGSTATIGGKAFITLKLNGEEVTLSGTEQATTLRQTLEAVNANTAAYSENALQAVRSFCTAYANWMTGWTIENIMGADEGNMDVEITIPVASENNVVTQSAVLSQNGISAKVPAGTKLEEGTTELVLTIYEKESSDSDVALTEGQSLMPLDVHISGISKENTAPVIVCLGAILPDGLNIGNYNLYHVEKGETVKMERVFGLPALDTHNEFYYDPTTGCVTVAMASFSEVALQSMGENLWNGESDTSWYNDTDTEFEIYNADQLAGLGELVDGGNTFAGKTVTMIKDIDLKGTYMTTDEDGEEVENRRSFNPIGYGYDIVFSGTFDGNGNTISNLYQHGWDMGLSYSTAGGGLFASAVDANFKNLTLDNAYVVMECIDMGALVGYAYGTCHFENIVVSDSVIANYNRYTGGVIGEVNGNHTLINVDVDAGTTISALWGTFDPSIGGLIGGKWGDATVYMEKCDVACTLDVYNDVTSAYQWYSYRRCGMLIGNTEESRTEDSGRTIATASFLTTKDCTVSYGDWVHYHYCEFNNAQNPGNRYPWVRVEEGLSNSAYSNPRYGYPNDVNNNPVINAEHHHAEGDSCTMEATFHQLYGGGQGCYGGNDHIGKGVTEIDAPTPAAKFASKVVGNYFVVDQYSSVTLGELFAASRLGTEIQTMDVYAYLSPADENEAVRATFNKVNDDWTMSTFVFTGPGEAKITISDYYYCEPTVIYVFVKCTHESFDEDGCCIHCGAHRDDVILNPEIPENPEGDF